MRPLALLVVAALAAGCTQVTPVARGSDAARDPERLNPLESTVDYDVDLSLALDYPERICIGAVTIDTSGKSDEADKKTDTAESAKLDPATDKPPTVDGADKTATPDEADKPDKPDKAAAQLRDLVRRSLVMHAYAEFEPLGIAVVDTAAAGAAAPGPAADSGAQPCSHRLTAKLVVKDAAYTLVWSRRRIGLEVTLVQIDDGRTIWTARHVASRSLMTMPLDPISLVMAAFRTQDFANEKDMLPSMVDDAVRRIFTTFPSPTSPDAAPSETPGPEAPGPDTPARDISVQAPSSPSPDFPNTGRLQMVHAWSDATP